MKTVIVYYSLTGNVRWAAEQAAEALGADLLPLVPSKAYPDSGFKKFFWGGKSAVMGEVPRLEPYAFDAAAYDLVVLAGPVWASTFAPPLRTFVRDNREALAGKNFAALLCYSGGGADKALDKLRKELDVEAWRATVVLTDPKDRPSEANDALLSDFCRALEE